MSRRHKHKRRGTKPTAWDLTKPARNSAGDYQIAQRSCEADRERLAHLPVTIFDHEGVAAHVAGAAPPRRFKRPETQADRRHAYQHGGQLPAGRGAPMDLIEHPPPELAAVEQRVDKQRERGPNMIRTPRTRRDAACNQLAHMTPLRRLAWLRRIVKPVADAPAIPASA